MTELTPRIIDDAIQRIMLIVAQGNQKIKTEQDNPEFAARSKVIAEMREKRIGRGRGQS